MTTSCWYSKDLGNGVEAFNPSLQIQEILFAFFGAVGLPKNMAVFSRYDRERDLVTVYLPPANESVARAIGATPCEKPTRQDLIIMIGHSEAMDVLFPE